MDQNCCIRMARAEDAQALADIFRPYVLETAVAFEYNPPGAGHFRELIENRLRKYPFLVAEENGEIMGYLYVSPFKARPAYDWAIETSIYIRRECRGKGYGRMLHDRMEELLKKQNILSMYACIAYTEVEDQYLVNHSKRFHTHMGYELTATFPKCGYKFNKWYDIIWMHKEIGQHGDDPAPIIPITELNDPILR